ncbi:MAG: hypothetical protein KC583_16765, partial [Myxococcales bacterium]|nr:hypothetical protein [Myxococcales bacterium]
DGGWSACDGASGPEREFCDGADNDCDGATDEGLRRPCGSDEGVCVMGEQTCAAGDWGDCVGEVAPAAERCNGLDDDCDGTADEAADPSLEPDRSRCPDQGVCAGGRARPVCEAGAWRCELPPDYVPVECDIVDPACGAGALDDPTCRDGVDNDCDGLDDENDAYALCRDHPDFDRVQSGEACFAALRGRCGMNGGTYECVQLAEGCGVSIDCIGATFPAPERCDGQDWDCDGQVDDRGDDDGDGFGDCPGLVDCDEGAADVHPGAEEICNGVDDDCDEAIDEGVLNTCGACGPDPVEVCDGVDDDCDGSVDEGTLNACGACGPEPAEACNNLDDDCDGAVDEGLPPDCVPGTCEAPFDYPSEGGRVTGTITGTATQDGGCRHVGVDHVYRWTAPTTGMAEITATGNFNPISLFLLDGDCEGAEVACDYQPDPGATNRLSAPVVAGRTYRLVVGHGNYRGDIALRYTLNLAPPCEPVPEIPGNGRDDDCNGVVDDVCGDGQLQGAEQCDDANAAACDGCERCQRLRHLVFDPAAQSQVVVPDTADAPLALQGTPFTVEYWGRLDDASERLDVQRRAEGNRGWGLTVFEGGVIGAGYQRATVRSEGQVIVGTGWHHYAWTWDGTNTRLFFDGQQVDEGAPDGDELVRDVSVPVHIGSFRDADGVVTLYNKGAIDEIRISSVARYDGPFTPARRHTPDGATLALWHADEGAGEQLVDASALEHHGAAQSVGWAADDGYGRFCE